jgi:thioredoxin reductase
VEELFRLRSSRISLVFQKEISGAELTERMVKQAEKLGAEIRYSEEVLDLVLDDRTKITTTRHEKYESTGIIIATGTQRKKLSVPGETEFLFNRGAAFFIVRQLLVKRSRTSSNR